ncbi:MAG: hypothetical protein F6K23_23780 [Okeania sp. SIO2C9]|uniref:hypothetical protein n=1 Tax=Okeania sp. SIO2C9 TaxID=2607791 RepID=UPI0013C13C8A|nr:hypothetical protein [Okeania sp. SIO2C9]NEQ75795.1 hypothetical protein [Okeania sp. SIO2C9]
MSRRLISKYQNHLANPENAVQSATGQIIQRMLEQVKVISILITYSWRYNQPDSTPEQLLTAQRLQYYFRHTVPDPLWRRDEEVKRLFPNVTKAPVLEDLMGAELNSDTIPGEVLCTVFATPIGYVFPIFEKIAIDFKLVSFEIDTGIFNGWITDPDPNSPHMLTVVIAFPPRPALSDATVTNTELEDWIDNRSPVKFMSENPYIPTCSC